MIESLLSMSFLQGERNRAAISPENGTYVKMPVCRWRRNKSGGAVMDKKQCIR